MKTLIELRQALDKVDAELLQVLTQRASLALEIGHIKHATRQEEFYQPEREAEIIQAVKQHNHSALSHEAIEKIYLLIMKYCLELQQQLKVSFLGPEGSFTHEAMAKHFGEKITPLSCETIEDIFVKVNSGEAHFGIVPLENSLAGRVPQTQQALQAYRVEVVERMALPIHLSLIAAEDAKVWIEKIYAHEFSFLQSSDFLQTHYPEAEHIALPSNSQAVVHALSEKNSAAIAGEGVMAYYSVKILAKQIENHPVAQTTFIIFKKAI